MHHFLAVIVFLLSFAANADSMDLDAKQQAVDEKFSSWDSDQVPGAGLGVFKDGQVVYARGYGMANLEHNIANDENSVFRIGSTSKQFTAACIVLLEMQGKLKFSDSLDKYFPDFPAYAKEVTIQHLLNHTSGVRDYLTLAGLKGLGDDDYYQDQHVESWLAAQQALNFEPGEEDLYSNSGYWLLGQIVNKAAGMNMADYAEQEIFRPLGMNSTHFHNDHNQIVKNRAAGYAPTEAPGQYRISMTTLDMIGDGGIFTSIADIKKWDDAYYQSDVLSPQFWQTMTTVGQLNDGKQLNYAAGLIMGEYKGLKTISHGGAFVGFRAELLRFPEQKFTVAVFANRADANPTARAFQVADIYLADAFKVTPQPVAKDSDGAAQQASEAAEADSAFTVQQLTGSYEVRAGVRIEVTEVGGQVHAHQQWNDKAYMLTPIAADSNTYQIGDDESIRFTFVDLNGGKAQAISIMQGGETTWNRVEATAVTAVDINDFVGDFYSAELDVVYQFSITDEQLYLAVKDSEPFKVHVAGVDELTAFGNVAKMFRSQGQVKGFSLDAGRVQNLKFVKQ